MSDDRRRLNPKRILPSALTPAAFALAFLINGAQAAAQGDGPTATPSPVPTATASPEPLRELLIEGGYTLAKVYNNYADGVTGTGFSYVASGAYRFGPWAVKFDERTDFFSPPPNVLGPPAGVGFSTPDGGYSVVPPFTGRNTDLDVRAEHNIFGPNSYAGLSYVQTSTSYGYPTLTGVGFGLEQYSDFTPFGFYGSVFYYPSVTGSFLQTDPASPNFGKSFGVRFSQLKYSAEASLPLSRDFYAYFGYGGYRMLVGTNSSQNVEGPYAGIGTRLFRGGSAKDEPNTLKIVQTNPNYRGYLEGALRFGGENAVGAIPAAPDGAGSYQVSAAYRTGPWAATFDFHQDTFASFADPVNPVTPLTEHDTMAELRGLISVTPHDLYLGLGLLHKTNDNGFGDQTGPGLGFAKLPNLVARFSGFGSVFYYIAGATLTAGGTTVSQTRRYLVYDYGLTYRAFRSAYVYAGFWGYHGEPADGTIDETHSAPYAGIGFRF
ncbi:MAG TPA: hypothetical protein VGF86_05325 [Candidatus Tumulicola sp.]